MVRTVWLVSLLITVLPAAYAAGEQEETVIPRGIIQTHRFYAASLERDFEYRVYLPPAFSGDGTYPVLYLLHGRGDSMFAWDNAADLLDELINDGVIPPLVAIMPDMPSSDRAGYFVDSLYDGSDYNAEPVETAFFEDLLPHAEHSLPVAAVRAGRIVGGYSMGGYGAVRYALAHADIFSAAIVLSPAVYSPLPPAASSAREFGAFGVGENLFDDERYRELTYLNVLEHYRGGRTPIRMFIAVGDDEWKHSDPAEMMHDLDVEAHLLYTRLSRVNGVQTELRVYDGGHDWTVWRRGLSEGLAYLATHLRLGGYFRSDDHSEAEDPLSQTTGG